MYLQCSAVPVSDVLREHKRSGGFGNGMLRDRCSSLATFRFRGAGDEEVLGPQKDWLSRGMARARGAELREIGATGRKCLVV